MRSTATPNSIAYCRRIGKSDWLPTTWNALSQEIKKTSAAFRQLGLQKGDRLAILSNTRREWLLAELAALFAGASVVGVDTNATTDLANFTLIHSDACALIADRLSNVQKLSSQTLRRLKFVVVLDNESTQNEFVNWKELCTPVDETAQDSVVPVNISANDPAIVVLTSGTTGGPKAIEYSHRQLLIACQSIIEKYPEIEEGDSTLCWLPMAHLFQRIMNLVAIARGMTTFFVENPRDTIECARQVHPSVFFGVPRFYEKLHEGICTRLESQSKLQRQLFKSALHFALNRSRAAKSANAVYFFHRILFVAFDRLVFHRIRRVMGNRLKFMITGSAPAPLWLLEFFESVGLPLIEAYGLSENVVPVAGNGPTDYRLGSVGKPFPTNEVRIARNGEILVKGPGVFSGYYRTDDSNSRFTSDGFLCTGDCGYLDDDGFLYITGRKSEIIKTSTGRQISPVEVERSYNRSPFFDHVIVIGNGRKHLVALVTLNSRVVEIALRKNNQELRRDGSKRDGRDVKDIVCGEFDRLGLELPQYARVRNFAILGEPLSIDRGELTSSLKVRRRQVEDRYATVIDELYAAEMQPELCAS